MKRIRRDVEIVVSERVLAEGRRNPGAIRPVLERVLEQEEEGLGAARLPDQRILGWKSETSQLTLHFLVEEPSDELEPPLLGVPRSELLALGVPDEQIGVVRKAQALAEIEAMSLPESVRARLRFMFVQQAHGLGVSPGPARRASDLDELDRFLRGDIRALLLALDRSQRSIVELDGPGPIVVRGVAGSGKTAVALHRIHRQLRQRSLLESPRILLLTFNRALAQAARELLLALGLEPKSVQVATLHHWCRQFTDTREPFLTFADRRALIRQAVEEVRRRSRDSALWSYPPAFWEEELHRIKGSVLGGEAEYLELPRRGAQRKLDARLRELVWQVLLAYEAGRMRAGKLDWDDVVRRAWERLEKERPPPWDQVVLDEAQDLTPIGLKVAAKLAGPAENLFLAFDPAQSIFERGFRWKDVGLRVHGSRSFELRRNYRNTASILDAARQLLANIDEGEEEAPLVPEAAMRDGHAPRLLAARPGEEAQTLAADIRRLIENEGVPARNISVLCYPNSVRDRVFETLTRAGIRCQKHDAESGIRLADASVKVLPVKSAKGLEFPVVYLWASGRDYLPPSGMGEAERLAWREDLRKLFYMAMTRALSRLVLVHAEGDLLFLLRGLQRG